MGESPIPLAAAKQQALLAAGLLAAGRLVSVDRLVDAVWGADAPATAADLVKSYVSALRRLVHRPDERPVILTRSPGYVFRVEPDALDLHRFESNVEQARRAAARNRHDEASRLLREALQLWRGPALGGLGGAYLQAEAARLEELRRGALEERIAADLAQGRTADVLPELIGLVAADPLRERLRGQLMVALARLGRQADALSIYQDGRAALRDEFGLDPGLELQRLHQAILTGRDTVEAPITIVDREPEHLVPAQLPSAASLVGRSVVVSAVRAALDKSPAVALYGKPGSGKTAVALRAAHAAAAAAFPDGQLYASLEGSEADGQAGDPPDAGEVLGRLLRALGHPAVGESTAERAALFRSAVAGRRVLVVLDGARSEAQVRPLLPGTAGSAVLLTSRTRLAALDGAEHLELDVLAPDDAVELLARLAGPNRVRADPGAAGEIARLCGYLPLALRAAGARLAARPRWPLMLLADRLLDERRRLDELAAGDLGVRSRLDTSYHALSESERRAFALLGAVNPPELTAQSAARLLNLSLPDAERVLDRIAEAQLLDLVALDADGQPRYAFHELTRIYAGEHHAGQDRRELLRPA